MWSIGRQVGKRLRRAQVLVLDEVSMLSGSFLDKAAALVAELRGSEEVFGGLQLVLCGDFLQLPPICDLLAFQSSIWPSRLGSVASTSNC